MRWSFILFSFPDSKLHMSQSNISSSLVIFSISISSISSRCSLMCSWNRLTELNFSSHKIHYIAFSVPLLILSLTWCFVFMWLFRVTLVLPLTSHILHLYSCGFVNWFLYDFYNFHRFFFSSDTAPASGTLFSMIIPSFLAPPVLFLSL